ncbi:Piwi domain-containing protein [Glomus cerebriforme]|uniref:Piwi domain-containing protein n=1 Tax=Glomus cerebriforme TaxID=658196 RepID=A0A397S8G8_9GLOM|nr:Piwi domain-containing protein [Glomus cerebriforme]
MEAPFAITEFVKRHGLGHEGSRTRVRANFFEVITLPVNDIIQYDVIITPDVPPRLNRKVFNKFSESNRGGALGGARPVYDGRKNMFAHKDMPFGNAGTFDVNLEEDGAAPVGSKRPPRLFTVKIKKVGVIRIEELLRFLNARGSCTANCLTAIMALDILIHHEPSILYNTVRKSFFTPQGARPFSGGMEVWQGYYQSARPTTGRMMINVDLSATVFYEAGPLVQMVTKILGRRSPDDLRRGFLDKDRQKVERTIKGLRIRDNHLSGRKRRFKIERLTPTSASNTQFDRGDGSNIDVATYFYQQHNRRLNHAYLPCVVVRKNVYLPMEVCDVIEGQRYMRKLNGKQTDNMIKFTCQQPQQRANKIRQGLDILNYRNNEYLRQFGMQISTEMAMVNARVLPTPLLHYHPSSTEASLRPKLGQWNLRDKKVATGATLGSWSILAFVDEEKLRDQIILGFVRELVNTCQETGMNIPNKNPPLMRANHQGTIEESLKKVWIKAGNAAKAQPQIILCILPNKGVPLYAEIKRVCDTVIGVASQCVQCDHMEKPKKQYCANVCLKMNVKLGGMNSFLNPTHIPFIADKPTIVMGADVTHPAPGKSERTSVAALCASLDAKASRYAASIRIQSGGTEIIVDLANMVKELLKTFYQTCGRKPERILFYRDGVSEGQFKQVLEKEIYAIRAACQALEETYKPNITFVVVQKRHHTRFFPIEKRYTDRTGNCLPGTVVETDITHPFEFDFYLQSHAGLQGTSRPTHYHVLFDENDFDADKLQTLSYNLCYLYARCTRAVSLVPPVYYADLVCTRARFHSPLMSDTESSEEGTGAAATFGVVKQELQRNSLLFLKSLIKHIYYRNEDAIQSASVLANSNLNEIDQDDENDINE